MIENGGSEKRVQREYIELIFSLSFLCHVIIIITQRAFVLEISN